MTPQSCTLSLPSDYRHIAVALVHYGMRRLLRSMSVERTAGVLQGPPVCPCLLYLFCHRQSSATVVFVSARRVPNRSLRRPSARSRERSAADYPESCISRAPGFSAVRTRRINSRVSRAPVSTRANTHSTARYRLTGSRLSTLPSVSPARLSAPVPLPRSGAGGRASIHCPRAAPPAGGESITGRRRWGDLPLLAISVRWPTAPGPPGTLLPVLPVPLPLPHAQVAMHDQ